ncbi:MAG: molybdenum cofactor guanylyltransferase MobA [Alphaproteobacteria bacterium]|nr:molybdenum cofactor guanylyltransferase MobA [Alphaproteobacteria bacterium]
MSDTSNTVGVILAGGLARRMGELGKNDKALLALDGRPILAHVIERLRPQVGPMVINANGDPERFAEFGLPVTPDSVEGFAGPLAGVLAGLDWAAAHATDAAWVVSIACDTPFFPTELVNRLKGAVEDEGAELACAASAGRHHPVFGLWPVCLRADLRAALVDEGVRKVDIWTGRHKLAVAEFATAPYDPFFNANRPDDLAEAERMLKESAL